jgi:hypothetical protein
VEDIWEPMHTNFGVPGLSGYPAIRYFVPALIKRRCWGVPYWHFCRFDYWGRLGGCLGIWSGGFPERMVAFQAAGTVALWPRRARRLVAGPLIMGYGLGVGGCLFRLFRRFGGNK